MRVLGSTVLVFEAIVVLLAIPIAINVSDANATFALVIGIALAGLLILTVGVITKPIAGTYRLDTSSPRDRRGNSGTHHVSCWRDFRTAVVLRGTQWAAG